MSKAITQQTIQVMYAKDSESALKLVRDREWIEGHKRLYVGKTDSPAGLVFAKITQRPIQDSDWIVVMTAGVAVSLTTCK